MITFLLDQYKNLVCTKRTTVNQHEQLVDVMYIVIPLTYNETDMTALSWYIRYVTLDNMLHEEHLVVRDLSYKENYMRMTVTIDTKLTAFADKIDFKIIGLNKQDKQIFISNTGTLEVNKVALQWAITDIEKAGDQGVNGLKFSPDGKKIYLTKDGAIVGTPIDVADLVDKEIIATEETFKIKEL